MYKSSYKAVIGASICVSVFLSSTVVFAEPNLPMSKDSWNLAPPSSSSDSGSSSSSDDKSSSKEVSKARGKLSKKEKLAKQKALKVSKKLQADIEKHNRKLSKLDDKIRSLNDDITDLLITKDKLESEISSSTYNTFVMQRDIAVSEKKFQESLLMTQNLLLTSQVNHRQDSALFVESVFKARSFSDLITNVTLLGQIVNAKASISDSLRDKEDRIKQSKIIFEQHVTGLREKRSLLRTKESELDAKKDLVLREVKIAQQAKKSVEQRLLRVSKKTASTEYKVDLAGFDLTKPQLDELAKRLKEYYASQGGLEEDKAQRVIVEAYKYLGIPYVWGGTTPDGFDCSGLMGYIFREVGIDLPRVARDQQNVGKRITPEEVQAGDMVFYRDPATHVGIYIGDGKYLHAPQPGDVVRIQDYISSDWTSAVRMIESNGAKGVSDKQLKNWIKDIKKSDEKAKSVKKSKKSTKKQKDGK